MKHFKDRLLIAAGYAGIRLPEKGGQTVIAKSLGINRQTVDHWLTKGSEPRNAMLFHIADTWNVSARWLATGQGDIAPLPPGQGLSSDERALLRSYRKPNDAFGASVRQLAIALGKLAVIVGLTLPVGFDNTQIAVASQGRFNSRADEIPIVSFLRALWRSLTRTTSRFAAT